MDYYQGERVRYLGKADWGPGLIEENSRDGKVRVRFLGAGKKLLHLKYAKLMKVKAVSTRPLPPGVPGRPG